MASRKVWKIFFRNKRREIKDVVVNAAGIALLVLVFLVLIAAFIFVMYWVSKGFHCLGDMYPMLRTVGKGSLVAFLAVMVLIIIARILYIPVNWIVDDWRRAKREAGE